MSEIPFVNELGHRLESAIAKQGSHQHRGFVAAVAAFAVTTAVLGGTFLWVAIVEAPSSSPSRVGQPESVIPLGSISVPDLVLALPVPHGMVELGGIDESAATNAASRKFSTLRGTPLSVMTVTIHYRNDAKIVPVARFDKRNLASHDTGAVTASDGMTVLEWEPIPGVVIQLAARGDSSDSMVDNYARIILETLATLGRGG